MKLACFSDTQAEPMRSPRRPSPSTSSPALTSPGTGLTNTEPQFCPPGWCSRRQRTISEIVRLGRLPVARPQAQPRRHDHVAIAEVGATEAQAEVVDGPAHDAGLVAVEVDDVDVGERRGHVRAVSAGVHPHRPADRAGHTDGPLEPGEPGGSRAPGDDR